MTLTQKLNAAFLCFLALIGARVGRADAPLMAAYSFPALDAAGDNRDGGNPCAPLLPGGNGIWFGTTYEGGANGGGTIFALSANGSTLTTLHALNPLSEGSAPSGALTAGPDGTLYGTAVGAGTGSSGSIFALRPDGSGFHVLHAFSGSDGGGPEAGVVALGDGFLYGTTTDGGSNGQGTVFKIKADGSGFVILHSFSGGDGNAPTGGLIPGANGCLYGTTFLGGPGRGGTVFQIKSDGSGFALLHAFPGDADGGNPNAGVTLQPDGFLYGTTSANSVNSSGTVYRVKTDGTSFQTLHAFSGGDGSDSMAPLTPAPDGTLVGTTCGGGASGCGTAFTIRPDGSGFQTLTSFTGTGPEGGSPSAGLTLGTDGAWYGTTWSGGTQRHRSSVSYHSAGADDPCTSALGLRERGRLRMDGGWQRRVPIYHLWSLPRLDRAGAGDRT